MKNILLSFFSIAFGIFISGCSSPQVNQNKDTLYQYSPLVSLVQGVYDGDMACGELKKKGDFGLGTFNGLDGEMIVLDSVIYQIASDGVAREMADDVKTPFAAVTFFESDNTITTKKSMNCTELKTFIDEKLPTKNIAYAIKIEGLFSYVKTRSEPKQTKPYAKLKEVLKKQDVFEFREQEGTLVGFKLPNYMGSVNAAGYHLHFLTADKNGGGHMLECRVEDVKIEIDYTNLWHVELPTDNEFYNVNITDETYQ